MGMPHAYLPQTWTELDREVDLGRGLVDFKASSGANAGLLREIRKVPEYIAKFMTCTVGLIEQCPG